jgi:hypothetical protein
VIEEFLGLYEKSGTRSGYRSALYIFFDMIYKYNRFISPAGEATGAL